DKSLLAHQWLPTRQELKRGRYLQKGVDGFPHPYIYEEAPLFGDYPERETGPAEFIYTQTIGATSGNPNRKEPLALAQTMLRAKMRDDWKCIRCGSTDNLCVHHTKGTQSHQLQDLETLCQKCHHAEHGYRDTTTT
ncbi:MAG: hypothetical protein GFH27_549281n1, partial [Chloroflexi bacterium AL-W]|nr:hypothetical protein [Chloroflexi bacterium AL-W]